MDVMMKMTTEDVRRLRAQFSTPLTLEQFVPLMKMNLRDRITNELDFVVSAVDLFHTIDVNGDKALEWDEFAGYMLDAGQAKADLSVETSTGDRTRYKYWDLAFRDPKTPMNCIKTWVQQLVYLPDVPALAYFEHGADVVSIYALHFDMSDAPRHFTTIRLHTAFQEHVVLAMCYIPVKKWLAISSMRGSVAYLSVWQLPEPTSHSRSPMMLRRIELASPQEQLTWLPTLQLLATASAVFPSIASHTFAHQKTTKIHQLLLWDLTTLTTRSDFDHRDRLKGVTSMVGFTTPSNRVFLVVGREDGQLTVVETETGQDVQTLDAHGHGVRVLAYSYDCEVLASAGAHAYASDESSHHILIWRIRSSGKLSVETTLRDHEAPLQLLLFVDSKRQLLSADIRGVYHVYSSAGRSPAHDQWQCLQVFDAAYRVSECILIPESTVSDAVLITAGVRVGFFDVCVSREREEIVFAYYCLELNLVVAVSATTVLLWDADTGKLWKSYSYASVLQSTPPSGYNDASGDDACACRVISAVCVDDRERKLLLGDDRGSVRVVNIVNGNVMKALDPHASAVLWLSYVLRSKRVISISLDAVLHVSDENNPIGYYVPFGTTRPQSVVLRSLRFLSDVSTPNDGNSVTPPPASAKFELTRAVGSQELDLLAVLVAGTKGGESFIQLWNLDMSHAQGTCIAPHQEEITCLSFIRSSSDIVGGTAKGTVYQWTALPGEGTTYRCTVELVAALEETEQAPGDGEDPEAADPPPTHPSLSPSNGHILHILTLAADRVVVTEAPSNPETATFLTADGAPSETPRSKTESSTTAQPSLAKTRNAHERLRRDPEEGVYVVVGDECGVVTTWHLVRAVGTRTSSKASAQPQTQPHHDHPTTTKSQNNTALLQHEEMAIGYDAVAAFHTNGLNRHRRQLQQHGMQICKARARWQAHGTAVASLRYSSGDAMVLLTASASGKVKIWSVLGDVLGVLDHFATRRVPERRAWHFPVDKTQRRRQKEAFATRFLDSNSVGNSSKRVTTRMTILQERLSMTPQEMANERMTPKFMRRRITTVVQAGDVERAIRNLALSQVSSVSKRSSVSRARARSIASAPSAPSDPSLHVLLSEVSSMKPPMTAPVDRSETGLSGVDSDRGVDGVGRRRYSMVTIADLKHALRPRSRAHELTRSNSKSTASVHCDLTLPPVHAQVQPTREVIVTATPATDGRIELTDLQSGRLDLGLSNQEAEPKTLKKKADSVLNYHVKLAHSWNKYAT